MQPSAAIPEQMQPYAFQCMRFSGFQDRRIRPLCHPSEAMMTRVCGLGLPRWRPRMLPSLLPSGSDHAPNRASPISRAAARCSDGTR